MRTASEAGENRGLSISSLRCSHQHMSDPPCPYDERSARKRYQRIMMQINDEEDDVFSRRLGAKIVLSARASCYPIPNHVDLEIRQSPTRSLNSHLLSSRAAKVALKRMFYFIVAVLIIFLVYPSREMLATTAGRIFRYGPARPSYQYSLPRKSIRFDWDWDNANSSRVDTGISTTFGDFLEERFPFDDPSPPHIWLTLAGGGYMEQIAGQQIFVDQLNQDRIRIDPSATLTEIVVLCMTEECMQCCQARRMFAYGGYRFNRPVEIREYTWPKLRGFIDILVSSIIFDWKSIFSIHQS